MTTPDPTRGDPVTDPHDRPYTFGWHGEVTRRLCYPAPADRHDPEVAALLADARRHLATDTGCRSCVEGIERLAARLAEQDRAIAERAWNDGWHAGADDMRRAVARTGPLITPSANPHARKDADQ